MDFAPGERDGTFGDLLEPGDHPQYRRLAAARGTEQGDDLAGRDRELEVAHCVDLVRRPGL